MAERQINDELILGIKVNYEKAIQGIANYNQKIDELKAKQAQLKEDFRAGTISVDEYQKALAAIKEETKVYKDGVRVLSKEIQNNVRAEKEQKDSLVALRSQLSNLTRQYDLLTKAERNSAKGKELQKKINDITTEIKNAEQETQRFYRNVGNYENAIRNALGVNGNFANSIMALKDAGGGNIMQGAITSVKAFGSSLKGLLANPAFLALAGIVGAGAAFKWFFDYNKGIEEATRLTREFTGLTGAALEDIRNSIQATADTFGKDYRETLQGVDVLMSQYHLTASEAIKVINDGFVAGADLSGNFLSQLSQFAPSFHDAGIAADEMVAIIAQTRSGIFSEGGLSLIQTASNRIRTMSSGVQDSLNSLGMSAQQVEKDLQSGSKSTFDVLQEISNRLKEMPQDSQVVGETLKNVFGKTAANEGLQMIESLGTMTTKMEEVKAVTGEYGRLQEEQIAASKELNDVMSALFDQSQNGFGEMIQSVKIIATKWLVSLIKGIIRTANALIDVYNESLLVRGGVQLIATSFKSLWSAVKLVSNLIIDAFKGVGRSMRGIAYILEGIVTFSFSKVKQGFTDLVTTIPKTISESIGDARKFGGEIGTNFADGVNKAVNGRVKHIEIATGAGDASSEPETRGGGSTAGGGGGAKGAKSVAQKAAKERARAVEAAAKAEADARKKENEEMKKAADLMLQLVEESYDKQRQKVAQSYDQRIADVRLKLTTEKNLTAATISAMNEQIVALEKLKQRDLERLSDEQMTKRIEQSNKEIALYLETIRKGSLEEYNLKVSQMQNSMELELAEARRMVADEETKQAMMAAIRAKYAQQQKELNDDLTKSEVEEIKKRWEERIKAAAVDESDPYPELTQLRLEMEMRKELLANARQLETETEEEFNTRKLQMQQEYLTAKKGLTDKEVEIETAKAQAIGQAIGALGDMMEEASGKESSLAKVAKVLALAEIAINSGVAISAGIKQAQSVPFPANLAAIATTVAAILAGITSAIKTVKSVKLAKGGLVEGEGTETSDSIPAMLSNGESVMTAKATKMFAPVLSVMNQLGGGVAIPGGASGEIGMDYMTRAMMVGFEEMPRPVVSVEEIDRVRNRVEVIERRRTIG